MVTILRTILPPVVAVGVLVAMAAFVLSHGDTMWRAVMLFDPWGIAAAIGLCVVYRVVNTGGWLLVLAALGQRVPALPATRIWLASEACRWIPGTVWSLGSRACLASARGVPLRVASASVALELVATVIGWT